MTLTLKTLIKSDLYRYCGRTTFRSFIAAYLRVPGFRFSYYLRKTRWYRQRHGMLSKVAFVYNRLVLERYRFRYGFELSYATEIGAGLYLGHFGGVVVNSLATIGKNVNIAQGVTIGQTNRGRKAGVPVVGDRVWIGANAIIVGAIRVGDDALIGPGAYVNFDVPARAVVLGNPGKIVSYAGTAGYIDNVVQEPVSTFSH
jgi:serine O-acetyltransferase